MSEELPYQIEPVNEQHVVVKFSEICDHERTSEHESELISLVDRYARIACDVSHTRALASDWVRWLYRMTLKAERSGKLLIVVGADETIKDVVDAIALTDKLSFADSLQEVWSR